MKKILFSGIVASVAVLLVAAPSLAGSFAQLSSSQNQIGGTTPKVVTLNQNDAVKGISNSKGVITFKEAGTYFVMAAAQVGSADGKGKGNVRLWMRQNGQDVKNSNTEQTIVPGFTAVLVCQGVEEIKAGDKLELVYSVSPAAESLGLIASKPSGEPVVPSMIFTAFKVDDSAYAQISSSETQTAAAAGKPIALDSTDAAKNIENNAGVADHQEGRDLLRDGRRPGWRHRSQRQGPRPVVGAPERTGREQFEQRTGHQPAALPPYWSARE